MPDIAKIPRGQPCDLTDNGRCIQCGECCTNMLPMSDKDVERIRKYVKQRRIKPVSHVPVILQGPTLDMVCPFLDSARPDGKCLIYPVRPVVCRHFTCRVYSDETAFRTMCEGIAKDPETKAELSRNRVRNVRATFYPTK